MLFVTPSGGGYGDPLERDPELVVVDVADELVSRRGRARRLRRGARPPTAPWTPPRPTSSAPSCDEGGRPHDDVPRGQRDAALRQLRQAADRRRPRRSSAASTASSSARSAASASSTRTSSRSTAPRRSGQSRSWDDRGRPRPAPGRHRRAGLDDRAGACARCGRRSWTAASSRASSCARCSSPRRWAPGRGAVREAHAPARAGGPGAARGAPRDVRPRDHAGRHPRRLPARARRSRAPRVELILARPRAADLGGRAGRARAA